MKIIVFDSGIEQPEDKRIYLKDIIENATTDREKSYCLDANYYKGCSKEYSDKKGRRQLVLKDIGNRIIGVQNDAKRSTASEHVYHKLSDKASLISAHIPKIITNDAKMLWRKLTPPECERLQTVNTTHEIEVELCLDQVKNYASAVEKSRKLQKLVLNVEKKELIEFVKFVVKNIQQNNLQIKHIVPQSADTLIQKIINKCTKHNREEKNITVDFAEKKTMSNYHTLEGDFVIQNVFTNIIQEKIINCGKVELHLKDKNLCYQLSGKKQLKLYGKEIMQFVKIADTIFQKTEKEKCIFTTLYRLNMNDIDRMLIILYWYAKIVIDIFIQTEISKKNILLNYSFENSYTNHVSNTQRYKMLGNGWTVDVIAHIFRGMY